MNRSDEKPVRPTAEQLHMDLRRLEWAQGLSEETLTAITDAAEWVEFETGEVVIEVDAEITHLYFPITGRVQSTLYDSLGKAVGTDTIGPGRAIALIALGSTDRTLLHVEAVEPVTAIRLTPSALLRLAAKHSRLANRCISVDGECVQAICDGRSLSPEAIRRRHYSSQRGEPATRRSSRAPA